MPTRQVLSRDNDRVKVMDNHGFNIPCEYLIACQEQREQKIKVRRNKVENINQQFNQCPNCGSERRFLESLVNEVKDRGYARKEWTLGLDFKRGAVIDPTREAAIPIGAQVPGYQITTDICMDCGAVYAVRIMSGEVTKSIAPPKLFKPGDSPPMGNDPRFS